MVRFSSDFPGRAYLGSATEAAAKTGGLAIGLGVCYVFTGGIVFFGMVSKTLPQSAFKLVFRMNSTVNRLI